MSDYVMVPRTLIEEVARLHKAQRLGDFVDRGWSLILDQPRGKFQPGDKVRKISGSQWKGTVVGTYSTALTPEGYAVESSAETGSVQIYPAKAPGVWVEEPALPDGWLLVPAEPSVEMLRAAQDALASEGLSVSEWMVHLTYRAAIDAALSVQGGQHE